MQNWSSHVALGLVSVRSLWCPLSTALAWAQQVPLVVTLPRIQLLGVHNSGQVPKLGPSTALFCHSSSSLPLLISPIKQLQQPAARR